MKRTILTANLAILGLMAFCANSLKAQTNDEVMTPLSMNFKLTVQFQDMLEVQVGSSPIFKSTVGRAKVTTKTILELAGLACGGMDFTGYSLVVEDFNYLNEDLEGDFYVLDRDGNVVTNLTAGGFLSNFFDSEDKDYLVKEIYNDDTDSSKGTSTFMNEIEFTDSAHANSFIFHGTEQWTWNYNGNTGAFTDTFKLPGGGTGALETPPSDDSEAVDFFILSGTVSGRAKGID